MITTIGYEELKRLHNERVARSLRRFENARALQTSHAPLVDHIEPCRVIELSPMRHPEHRIGA